MATPILHDIFNLVATLAAQAAARTKLRCSVCEASVDAGYELDDSGRCQECQP